MAWNHAPNGHVNRTTPNPDLARSFEQARKRAGLSLFRIAARAGLHPNTVGRISYGVATARTLNAVARVLGLTVDQLSGRKPLPAATEAA